LEGDPLSGSGRLDLNTGEVWPAAAIEYARETGEEDEDTSEDPDRWLWVRNTGSRAGYRDMAEFIDTVTDPDRADRLGIAIQGRGAFRRFKDTLARWPVELEPLVRILRRPATRPGAGLARRRGIPAAPPTVTACRRGRHPAARVRNGRIRRSEGEGCWSGESVPGSAVAAFAR